MKLNELIAKLPEDLRPLAVNYGELWVDATAQQLERLGGLLIDGRLNEAFKFVVQHLSTEQLIAEMERINTEIKSVNEKQLSYIETQRQIVREALTIGINILLAKARAGLI